MYLPPLRSPVCPVCTSCFLPLCLFFPEERLEVGRMSSNKISGWNNRQKKEKKMLDADSGPLSCASLVQSPGSLTLPFFSRCVSQSLTLKKSSLLTWGSRVLVHLASCMRVRGSVITSPHQLLSQKQSKGCIWSSWGKKKKVHWYTFWPA